MRSRKVLAGSIWSCRQFELGPCVSHGRLFQGRTTYSPLTCGRGGVGCHAVKQLGPIITELNHGLFTSGVLEKTYRILLAFNNGIEVNHKIQHQIIQGYTC